MGWDIVMHSWTATPQVIMGAAAAGTDAAAGAGRRRGSPELGMQPGAKGAGSMAGAALLPGAAA